MRRRLFVTAIILGLAAILSAKGAIYAARDQGKVDLKKMVLRNETAYIPPQCYTRTEDADNTLHNPCYVCHTRSKEPNYINDWELQISYAFPDDNLANPWTNLFEDRSQRIAAVTDEAILAYIRQDNYLDADGGIRLAKRLAELPRGWDYNDNGRWDGYLPDCFYNFDDQGFDHDPQGRHTGWRAFAYYPFPGTYWPTNGSTDDVLIRLPESFRTNRVGQPDLMIYKINLAIVEAIIKGRDVTISPVDEKLIDADLNKDGQMTTAKKVVFDWDPLKGRLMSFVGQAGVLQRQGRLHLAQGFFPEGTEFLQSVRYVDVKNVEDIGMANRFKELRYMKKRTWQSYADLEEAALNEIKEKDDFPGRTRQFLGNLEQGVNNGTGWLLQGFIEDARGELRPQSFEEMTFCAGCHGGVGAATDSIFSFPRKLDAAGFQNGWYHWRQKALTGLNEPKVEIRNAGVFYEYSYYLMYNRSGNELRSNDEVEKRFFFANGAIKPGMLERLHDDISILLNPTHQRALTLNKAYRTIVQDQDFILGRDANIKPLVNVHREVETNQPTGMTRASDIERFNGRFGGIATCFANDLAHHLGAKVEKAVLGIGMGGPNGQRYGVNWHGEVVKNRYQNTDIKGVQFTFPPRLTLPTRVIVPIGNMTACYACHRLPYPNVPPDNRIVTKVPMPPAQGENPQLQQLTSDSGADKGGVWRPDGQEIAFVSDRGGSYQIWLMAPDGGDQRQLTYGPAVHGWPAWHPEGRKLACWSYNPQTEMHALKSVNTDGKGEMILAQSREHLDRPAWHPDGYLIAYTALAQGNWDIWLVSDEGGQPTRLTSDPQMETNPLWNPDGHCLAFKVAPIGEYNLTRQYFMTFEKGYDTPTVFGWNGPQSIQMNAWSPDGGRIAYTAETISDATGDDRVTYTAMISKVSLESADAVAAATIHLARGRTIGDRGPVFSPDGQKVVFWAWNKDYHASLWLYRLDENEVRALTSGGFDTYPQWRPDGKTILFESSRSGNLDLWITQVAN